VGWWPALRAGLFRLRRWVGQRRLQSRRTPKVLVAEYRGRPEQQGAARGLLLAFSALNFFGLAFSA
jgi:hypothetical protein